MSKTRVGTLFKDTLHIGKTTKKSKDLEAHLVRYHELQKKIRSLLTHLKTEHSTLIKYHEARTKVATQIALLATRTPLIKSAGGSSETPVEKQLESYSSIHKELAKKAHNRAEEFQKLVIGYVTEWDSVVTTRVDADMKKYVALRRDLDHYVNKVDHLKDMKVPDEEKVDRNVDKQTHARDAYENHVAGMCILLEEVTERSWKDLIPLLSRMAALDKISTEEEMVCCAKMNDVIDKLAAVAVAYNMEGCHKGDKSRFQKLANDEEPYSLLSPPSSPQRQSAVDVVKGDGEAKNCDEPAESTDGHEETTSE